MERIAQIWVNIPTRSINKPYSYRLPESMDYVDIGWRVLVSFGNRQVEGFVIELADGDTSDLKPVSDVLDSEAWFNENMLKTAQWLSEYYLCPLAEALRLFIPGKSGIKAFNTFRLADDIDSEQAAVHLAGKSPEYHHLFMYLYQHGLTNLIILKKHFGLSVVKILNSMVRCGCVIRESVAKKTNQTRYQTMIQLAIPREIAAALQENLTGKPAQQRLVAALVSHEQLDAKTLKNLHISQDTVKRLLQSGVVAQKPVQIVRDSYAMMQSVSTTVVLSPEQKQVLMAMLPTIKAQQYQSFLLHGITGSGKTQVYIEAVAYARQSNRQAIVLVPEIALTGQIVARFKARFGDDVVVIHSKLSAGERSDTWQRLRSSQAGIVIGARSAVFAPLPDLGIIIIDEEHEFTYKQEESPRYHTRQVALFRSQLAGATVVFGSATPAIETYYHSLNGQHTLLTMSARIDGALLPTVEIIDMREELRQRRRSVISLPLQNLLSVTITRGEQAIILLNRRGYATFVLCRECGHIMRCSHCAVSLVYHATGKVLRCHYCQSTESVPDICPACGSHYIRFFGTGTQKLEEELERLFPDIRIARMDQDTTGGKMAHDRILNAFAKGEYDILLGTQMVAKGHDVKNVTAVGIITADTALNLPDFRAAERTFALLTQAAGRAGRGQKPGQVVVQTYNPEHYAIQASITHDYNTFYQTEIKYRQELGYPPFGQMIKLTVQATDEKKVRRHAETITAQLRNSLKTFQHTEVIGPFPPPVTKINDIFRLNILIKTPDLTNIKLIIAKM
ncbi:MAG TPA: primosomal protein N', partial [Negativicutes bacterium]